MKLLFVLSGNISTTPRASKIMEMLYPDHQVRVIYVNRKESWLQKDIVWLKDRQISFRFANLGRKPLFPWIIATLIERSAKFLNRWFKSNLRNCAFASNKSSILLSHVLHEERPDFDLVLGFSAGSLFPAYEYSQRHKIPFVFDVEDYHPGEYVAIDPENEKRRREYLFKAILPKVNMVTFASPLIEKYTRSLVGVSKNYLVILNSFPEKDFIYKDNPVFDNEPLRLVWFSQRISFGRGLEELIAALSILRKSDISIKLTLIGDLDPSFETQVINPFIQEDLNDNKSILIEHIPPFSQSALHRNLENYDIGLALEIGKDLNNELAISNKIIAYTQAGLFILTTDILAQKQFIESYPWAGLITSREPESIVNALTTLVERKNEIRVSRVARYKKGRLLSWEKDFQLWYEQVSNLLNLEWE